MKNLLLIFSLFISFGVSSQIRKNKFDTTLKLERVDNSIKDYTKYRYILDLVNPFIGTGGHGHTYPGASAPFGMMQLSPDTRYNGWDGCSGYHYSDSIIWGFSHTHLSGTGVEDYCDLLIVPQIGKPRTTPGYKDPKEGYGATFSHNNEKASPGYYSVKLDNGIFAEFTVSKRAGIHHYTFPQNGEKRYLLIDLTHRDQLTKFYLKKDGKMILGVRNSSSWAKDQRLFFYIMANVEEEKYELLEDGTKLLLQFPASVNDIELRVGLSAVDEKGAITNAEKELRGKDFATVKADVENEWLKELTSVIVDRSNNNQATVFYTALYHSYLAPNIFSDIDRRYLGQDKKIHSLDGNDQYTVFSLWDTYRATHPWYTMFQQKKTLDFIVSFGNMFNQGGNLPVWELAGNETYCMIGYHSASVIADAYVKGIKKFNVPFFIKALQKTAEIDHLGKLNFNNQGFIDYKVEPESVSKTLEYAYDSYCIYTFLEEAKKDNQDVSDSLIEVFKNRAFNFVNIFDPQTGFMRARNGGIWFSPFKPEEVNFNFTEANSWQYSLYAPHAIPVLAELLGGTDALEKWLNALFAADSKLAGNNQVDITGLIGQYAHGNEPSHHMAYLYNYTNSPEKTAIIVDSILNHYYHNAPDGLSGNEDCGQMSSWYTFSALGFYPVAPGSAIYDFGRPLFNTATLRYENGRMTNIIVKNNSAKNKFIQEIRINNEVYKKRYITHQDLMNANVIEFTMGPLPSPEYRTYEVAPSIQSLPTSFVAVPYFKNVSNAFTKSTSVEISSPYKNLEYYYTLDDSTPTNKSKKYKKPFRIKKSTVVKVVSYNPQTKKYSNVIENEFKLKPVGVELQLNSAYAKQYSASGDDALIDGMYASHDFRSGDWQGFYNNDVNGIVSFSKPKTLTTIGLSALQSTRSWIFPPKSVTFKVNYADNTSETVQLELKRHPSAEWSPEEPVKFEITPKNKAVKSIEFTAYNYGVNPDWHLSPGYATFIFMDEVYFK
ncbi:MAG: GH92 family glycosyl hydrolase [Crocinitomicaceae bacterium]|nr:GH92 family glycosyl hydrolase [Crocinitomicaceae bacterium]